MAAEVPVPVTRKTKSSIWPTIKGFMNSFLSNLPNMLGLIQWVNVYTVTRVYSASSEGGNYYRRYTCMESRQVWCWEAEALQMQLRRRYSGLEWGLISTSSIGHEIAVLIESRKSAHEFAPVSSLLITN